MSNNPESVNEGHPDKLCDQISDAILDVCLAQDPDSKVACETCTKTNMVMVFDEITTKVNVDYEAIVRDTCRAIQFVSDDVGLHADHCKVLVNIEQQSPDITQGVHGHFTKRPEEIGAGDQGHMFGYATDETEELMPLSHVLATELGAKLTEMRKNGTCAWLRPDGKTQAIVEYHEDNGAMVPIRVHTVLISTQHDEIAADLKEHVIKPVIPEKYLDDDDDLDRPPAATYVVRRRGARRTGHMSVSLFLCILSGFRIDGVGRRAKDDSGGLLFAESELVRIISLVLLPCITHLCCCSSILLRWINLGRLHGILERLFVGTESSRCRMIPRRHLDSPCRRLHELSGKLLEAAVAGLDTQSGGGEA